MGNLIRLGREFRLPITPEDVEAEIARVQAEIAARAGSGDGEPARAGRGLAAVTAAPESGDEIHDGGAASP